MTTSKYDYSKLYNEHWQQRMNQFDDQIGSVGILRFDKNDSPIFGFANVFNEDDSPYDFCARIGYTVLENLMNDGVESLKVSPGCYGFGKKVFSG